MEREVIATNAQQDAPGASRGPVSPKYKTKREVIHDTVYAREEFGEIDGIPLFSVADHFVEVYSTIARDHVAALMAGNQNPFMQEELSTALEESTRRLVLKHAQPGDMVLDVGVGPGRLLAPMTQFKRYGVDISLDYLRLARDEGIDVAFARIEDLPYKSEIFDVVVTTDVLEHVLDLNYCTSQILRVLKPGGVLIARVPHNDLLEAYLDPTIPYEFVHVRKFDVPSLRLHFEKIFSCTFVEDAPVYPYFKGGPTLRLQSLPHHSFIRDYVGSVGDDHPIAFLKPFLAISQEELMNRLGVVRDSHPDVYKLIAPHLFEPLEVNVVFTKRQSE